MEETSHNFIGGLSHVICWIWSDSWCYACSLAMTLFLIPYVLYYLFYVVNRPVLVGGGNNFRAFVLQHCPTLTRPYWPTVWAFNVHMTTILRSVLQWPPRVVYCREILTLHDGGEVALDWAVMQGSKSTTHSIMDGPTSPVMLIMAGITGSSSAPYIKHLAWDGILQGYRPVVFNQRGTGGLQLKTLRLYCASKTDDLHQVVERIKGLYPHADIVGVGVSMGGMLLTRYVCQMGSECHLKAVLTVSCPWDTVKTQKSLEHSRANQLYTKHIANIIKSFMKKIIDSASPKQLEELTKYSIDINKVFDFETVSEFDAKVTVPLFGYSSLEEYYSDASNFSRVHLIHRPYLCVTAADDPFVPSSSLPISGFEKNSMAMLVFTSHGGHFGFLQGFFPFYATWMNTVCREFLMAMYYYDLHK